MLQNQGVIFNYLILFYFIFLSQGHKKNMIDFE